MNELGMKKAPAAGRKSRPGKLLAAAGLAALALAFCPSLALAATLTEVTGGNGASPAATAATDGTSSPTSFCTARTIRMRRGIAGLVRWRRIRWH